MKEARIYYLNDSQWGEGYKIDSRLDKKDDWGTVSFFPLVKRENEKGDDKNFVHFSIINKLFELKELGYKVYFL